MTTCLIDGKPVPLVDWSAQVDADWGDRQLTGTLPILVPFAEQEAPIELWTPTGDLLWSGTLAQDPRPDGDGWAIRALGPAEGMAENRTRLFYRIDGQEQWVEQDAEPHEFDYPDTFDISQRRSLLKVRMGNGGADTIGVTEGAGFMIWVEGGLISRYEVLVTPAAAYVNFDFKTKRFTGPTGARTDIATHSLNIGSPTTYAVTMGSPEDAFYFRVEASADGLASTRRRVAFSQIKIYGRTTDDDFTASDAARDVAGISGLATDRVTPGALKVLPLDWTQGHPEFLDYIARLSDWRWMARGDGMHFGPWERTWQAFTNRDAAAQLEPEPRYNRYRVTFEARSGAHREVVAVPAIDPFPGREVVSPDEHHIEDPQPDTVLATAVAAAGVEHVAARNVNGPVELHRVRDDQGGVHSPYAACAGDLLSMPNLAPDIGPQRIRSITYRPDDQATAELGETFSPLHVIATTRREKRRPRRRRRAA